jgi:hypothetical protein
VCDCLHLAPAKGILIPSRFQKKKGIDNSCFVQLKSAVQRILEAHFWKKSACAILTVRCGEKATHAGFSCWLLYRGLSAEMRYQLPLARGTANETDKECTICKTRYNIGDHICTLPCQHFFQYVRMKFGIGMLFY